MLIVALVLAVIGLAALVTAVVTSNEVIAWVCIAASSLGVILLIVDAVRERQSKLARRTAAVAAGDEAVEEFVEESESADADGVLERDVLEDEIAEEDHPEELVHDEPDYDTYSDDEPEYPESAEESALHTVVDGDAEAAEKALEESGEPSGS